MTNKELNEIFQHIAEELDISDALFDKAVTSYETLGEYIGNHSNYMINVYTQGSFRLGTVVRPLSDEDEYDLDLVCEVEEVPDITPHDLKTQIGDILTQSKRYSKKLEEKKRCWRIEYSDKVQFHMDITPAIPDSTRNDNYAIKVTDKLNTGNYLFSKSNPKGYSDWFEERKSIKSVFCEDSSVEPVKIDVNKNKSPLQRAIQILKRHRDKMFESAPDDKPISIIITTLAANAYKGETGVYDTVKNVLETMDAFIIERNNEKYFIPNPTDPYENFAEKWNKDESKAQAFYQWLNKAREDMNKVFSSISSDDYSILEQLFGETVVNRAISDATAVMFESSLPQAVYDSLVIKEALGVSHRQTPYFQLPKNYMLGIVATYTSESQQREYVNNGAPIPKHCSIDFNLWVSPKLLKKPYLVLWQIVNTGAEARAADCLRGGFEKEYDSTKRHEETLYSGTHYVQAFLLKGGKCIAMSKEFIVNIQ